MSQPPNHMMLVWVHRRFNNDDSSDTYNVNKIWINHYLEHLFDEFTFDTMLRNYLKFKSDILYDQTNMIYWLYKIFLQDDYID